MMKLYRFTNRLLKKVTKIFVVTENSPFTDLTPVDNADQDGTYSKALSFALENSRIKNFALSGPYGSGKSSIIRTYEKNNDYNFLNISLASFQEDKSNTVDIKSIERSILQQMLYGADANKLPYSRFKRISTAEQPLFKSLLLVLWPIITISLYYSHNKLLDLESFSLLWFGGISLFAFVISLPVVIISDIYKSSVGLSLKKFSFKNGEVETSELSENSILNRHLDEIIYFFQVTDYDVVVIEDLDRFGDPEIFVKLREINKLINDNEKTSGQIKFLYALKDDMFVHENRTKFFDFIIPVVPIINSSNSLDKMQERLKEYDFAKSINTQFLREVSLYIDDLRLIHNIFNEFVIYYERLKSESLDVTKLLAMMIYKNVYPDDFENLHHGTGALFEICRKRSDYLLKSKNQLKEKQEKFRASLELANTEKSRSLRELIDTYVGHIVMYASKSAYGIVCNNQHIAFSRFKTFEQFEPMLSEKNIQIATDIHVGYKFPINKSFSQIEEEINPGETFLSRKENIENNSIPKKIELQQKIKRVDKDLTELSQLQLFQLLQSSDIELDKLINGYEITDGRLLVYLVRNGYLDDNYHLYISNFHEGRLTKNDRDYLLTIRNFNQPDPNQRIDTPKEVCANMREEDFGHKYVLNVTLVDYLLESNDISSERIKSTMYYISQNFEQSEEFLTAYFIAGNHLEKFTRYLSREWPGLALAAISSEHGAEQISYILKFVDAEYVSKNMNKMNLLTAYLAEQGHLVLASNLQLPDDYDILKRLAVRFHDLVALERNKALVKFAHEECLYTITSKNVNYVLQTFADPQSVDTIKPEKANYTSILAAGSEYLKKYIEENLPDYIEKVFLTLPDNTEESETAIKILINNEMIEDNLKEKIILKQNYVFETFAEIPENLWSHLLLEEKVVISWQNISVYLSYEGNDKAVATKILGRQNIVGSLSNLNISETDLGEDDILSLSRFVINNNEINNADYCKLIKCLPYSFQDFPAGISEEKIKCLAMERKVTLTEKSFSSAGNDNKLVATLISKDFNSYIDEKEKYPINDDVRELLLSSEMSDENKIIVCSDVTPTGAIERKKLSRLIARLLASNEIDCSKFDDTVLSSAIINAQTIEDSIQLLTKCLSIWDEKKTMAVLADFPEPFSEISSYGKRPKLNNNEINFAFAMLLKTKDFISSLKEEGGSIKINTFKSSDHSEGNN
ncbi:MAG: hypothetical protein PHZ02_08780 [Desulfocapsaceae bacterium]|nr:hypothetical protein [Desulfocapsaceae bacterium]